MAHIPPELQAHKEWLGQIQQVGLVVSPNVLVRQGVFVNRQKSVEKQERLRELIEREDDETLRVIDWPAVCREILEWPDTLLAGVEGGPALPDSLTVALPEYDDRLSPTCAVPDPEREGEWLLLVRVEGHEVDFDGTPPADRHHQGWRTSPHARLERLLRETGVPIGLLFNGAALRLVYAPRGESSGHLTFRFSELVQTLGRPMVGALYALLGVEQVTDVQQEPQRLPALLKESRKYQNEVSTELAGQVLEALWELVRGFERANQHSHGVLLTQALREAPNDVYGGLLATLMRLVFVLYAEDRGLMPRSEVYQKHYSISGLFEKLRDDEARYPDTMDARYGAWAQLLALFRLIHDGGAHGEMRFPARHGRLFSPDAYPFLEGRPLGTVRVMGDTIDPPHISDGVVFRVLKNLLILDGERLSYRALDVEQIGSVYEAMMGFALQQTAGPSLATTPKHIVFNIGDLLEQKPKERAAWLQKETELKTTGDALAKAASVDEVVSALGKRVSRYTPSVLPAGAMYLQPTEERRRSGSHYTPRSLTEPIVRTTFRPILERLGEDATPEQILDLRVCDPAMGSGAFLVETCRLLAERLVRAWEKHKQIPKVPDDEDVLTYARRLVSERCLYGVDKNIFAVDLAKLSLWLATLASEHPFTFLDHALRHGDSLVGVSREQIACFNWEADKQLPLLRTLIDNRVNEAQRLREQIQGLAPSDDFVGKERLWHEATEALTDVRLIGDLVVSAFFEREKPKERQTLRVAYAGKVQNWLAAGDALELRSIAATLRDDPHPISPFHWEIEFPEVFTRQRVGFDGFVGNPPFFWGNRISSAFGGQYRDWLLLRDATNGNADLVVYFFRRAYSLLSAVGCLGLIATNSIAEGDTKSAGLDYLENRGAEIYSAVRDMAWPVQASVRVSVVHISKSPIPPPAILDGSPVAGIGTNLKPMLRRGILPTLLQSNSSLCFKGVDFGGDGFLLNDDEYRFATSHHEDELKYVRPVLNADDLMNSSPVGPKRLIINFERAPWSEVQGAPYLLSLVDKRVRPARLKKKGRERDYWWQYRRSGEDAAKATQGLVRVLVCPVVAKYLVFVFSPKGIVVTNAVNIFAFDCNEALAVLQSRVHECWALYFRTTLESRTRYNATDCFETFPFPPGWRDDANLREVAAEYDAERSNIIASSGRGLTTLYNRFHSPDDVHPEIVRLRELHLEMDRAVLSAYGWRDIQPRCEFVLDDAEDEGEAIGIPSKKKKPSRYRWPDEARDEILQRLIELNAQHAKAEALAGAAQATVNGAATRRKGESTNAPGGSLLDQ